MKKLGLILLLNLILFATVDVFAESHINSRWSVVAENKASYKAEYSETGGRNSTPVWVFEKNTDGDNVSFRYVIPAYMLKEDTYSASVYYKASGIINYDNTTISLSQGSVSEKKSLSNKTYWVKTTITLDSFVSGEDIVLTVNLGDKGNKIQISSIQICGSDGINLYDYSDKTSKKADWHGWNVNTADFTGSVYPDGGGVDGNSPYITITKISEERELKSISQVIPFSKLKSGGTYTLSYDYYGHNLDFDIWGNVEHSHQSWIQDPTYLNNTNEWKHIEKDITLSNEYDLNVMFRLRTKGAVLSVANLKLTEKGKTENLVFNSDFLSYGIEKIPVMQSYNYDGKLVTWDRVDHTTDYYNVCIYGDGNLIGKYNSFEKSVQISGSYDEITAYTEDVFGNKSEEKIIISDNITDKPFFLKSSDAFTFSFKGKEYVILDVTGSETSKYFVMSKDSCTVRSFDDNDTQKFDVYDSNNIAYYLNNALLKADFLPKEILDAIDYNHEWHTEAGPAGSECPEAYSQTMGIAVLSETEYLKHKERIGVVDGFYSKFSAWWLRTPESIDGYIKVIRTGEDYFDMMCRWNSKEWCGVRPVFYLDRDFFVYNELDYCGDGVRSILNEEYEPHEFKNNNKSDDAFLINYEYLNNGKKIVQGYDNRKADLYMVVRGGDNDENATIFVAYYDENNNLSKIEASYHKIFGERENYLLHKGNTSEWSDIRGYLWTEDMTPITKALSLNEYMTKVSISECTMGNIYTDDKQVKFNIKAEKNKIIEYSVVDFWGNIAFSGEFKAPDVEFVWTMPEQKNGHFTISFKYKDQPDKMAVKEIFCVVEKKDFTNENTSFFGVNAHMTHKQYGWTSELVDLMAIMGVKSIRTDVSWGGFETQKGVYNLSESDYLNAISKHKMTINFSSGFNNSLYDDGKVPYTEEGAKAFAKYQLEVIKRMKGLVTELDVYNEFYGGFGHLYGGGPARSQSQYYYNLLEATYDLIAPLYPDIKILANATTGSGYCGEKNWYANLLKRGAANKADGIYPHQYYTNKLPEIAVKNHAEFYKEKNKAYNAEHLKMYITEFGASNYTGGVSETESAKYVVRANVLWMNEGAEKAYWYDFMDDGSTVSDKEQNFGLVYSYKNNKGAYSPKPAYVAYAVLIRQLLGYEFKNLEYIPGSTADDENPVGIYIGHFEKNGEKQDIIWSLGEYDVTIRTDSGEITDMMGGRENINGENLINVSDEPFYLKGNYSIVNIKEI